MAIEKFRTRIFATSTLTCNSKLIVPYGTSAPTMADNGQINIAHVSNAAKFVFRSGGTAYTLSMPTASNGTVTITLA